MSDDLVKRLRAGAETFRDVDAAIVCGDAADRIEELEAKLAAKACPLGNECDLTVAYMVGAEKAQDTIRQQQDRIEELEAQLTRATAVLRKVDEWFNELEMYTAPDYHLAPALQEVKAILKEMDE